MDELAPLRGAVVSLLRDLAETAHADGDVEAVVITDHEHDQYQLLLIGWDAQGRVFDCAVHIRLRSGKLWIEQNTLPDHIAELLVAAGVARDQIVLGFQPHELRYLTGYAAA